MSDASILNLQQPPRVKTWQPLNLLNFYRDYLGTIQRMYDQYGPRFRWKAFHEVTVLLGAEANQWALVTQQKSMSSRQAWYEVIGELFQGGLLLRDGAEHRQVRRLLMPAFRQEALRDYLSNSEALVEKRIKSWPLLCNDIYARVKELTLEIAVLSFLGIDRTNELPLYNRLITDLVAGSICFNRIPYLGRTYHRALKARRELLQLFQPLLALRRREPGADMISHLSQSRDEDGQGLRDEEIFDQLIFIMMAAHDTTASTLSSVFYELGLHPEWQDLLRDEAAQALGRPIGERPDAVPLAQMVIKETLRLHTPLKVIPRVAQQDLEFQGSLIPKGTHVTVFPAFTHRMKEYWTQPEKFDPRRFDETRQEHKRHSYAFVPFGGGMHTCLGQFFAEKFLSVILGKIVLTRRWTLPDGSKTLFQQVPIEVPKRGLPVRFEPVMAEPGKS